VCSDWVLIAAIVASVAVVAVLIIIILIIVLCRLVKFTTLSRYISVNYPIGETSTEHELVNSF